MLDDQSALDYARVAERMRIAQQLHDSTSQLLAVLQLTLGRMRRQGLAEMEANITECEDIIAKVACEMRAIGDDDPDW